MHELSKIPAIVSHPESLRSSVSALREDRAGTSPKFSTYWAQVGLGPEKIGLSSSNFNQSNTKKFNIGQI